MTQEIVEIPLTSLMPNRYQPRSVFRLNELNELALSIQKNGVIQPITIRQVSDSAYEIICGERRWRAAELAGLTHIPSIIKRCTDQQAASIALLENLQREDLSPLEEARGINRVKQEFDLDNTKVAVMIGKSRSYISNKLRLLDLEASVQSMLGELKIEEGHAKSLAALPPGQQIHWAKEIIRNQWSCRKLEDALRQAKPSDEGVGGSPTPSSDGSIIDAVARKASETIGQPVRISKKNTHGQTQWIIEISAFSADELHGFFEKIGMKDI